MELKQSVIEGMKKVALRKAGIIIGDAIGIAAEDAGKSGAQGFTVAFIVDVGPSKDIGEVVMMTKAKTVVKLERKTESEPIPINETPTLFGEEEVEG